MVVDCLVRPVGVIIPAKVLESARCLISAS